MVQFNDLRVSKLAMFVSDGFFCYIGYTNFYQMLFDSFRSIVKQEMWVVRLLYIYCAI